MEVTLTQVLDDLRTADEILRRFERRYWLASADFYDLYQQGLLDDGERTEDYALWSGFYQISEARQATLRTLSGERVRQLRGLTLAIDPREPTLRCPNGTGFPARAEYETLLGQLPQTYPDLVSSRLKLRNSGAPIGILDGELTFAGQLRLRVIETVDFITGRLPSYAYLLWRGEEKLGWFDPAPSPNDHAAENYPHHYHDLTAGHQRTPALRLSFTAPNLPALVEYCLQLTQSTPA